MIEDLLNLGAADDSVEMPVISLWQPWANWVSWGWKTIETRRHARFAGLAGKSVGIHAAAKWDKEAIGLARTWLSPDQIAKTYDLLGSTWPASALVAVVLVTEHRPLDSADAPQALIECDTQRYGLIISSAAAVSPPYPCKGKQGIWRLRIPKQ